MRKLLFVALLTLSFAGSAQVRDPEDVTAQMKRDQAEAMTLAPFEVDREIQRQMELYRSLPGGNGALANLMAPELVRATAFTMALEQRAAGGDAQAAFFAGMRRFDRCQGMKRAGLVDSTRQCHAEVMQFFQQAHRGGVAAATFNIGTMYENGEGVVASKLAASDWYFQAAQRHRAAGDRSQSLTAFEAALSAAPDHGPAKRLRAELLK